MNGREYEYAAARWLRHHGWKRVRVTQASGDYGVDLTAERHGVRYAVQCKYYTHPVGIAAVQQAVAGKARYACDAAMVITNNTFTRAAHELAESNDVMLLDQIMPPQPFLGSAGTRLTMLILWLLLLTAMAWYETSGDPQILLDPAQLLSRPWILLSAALLPAVVLLALTVHLLQKLKLRVEMKRAQRQAEGDRRAQEDLAFCEQKAWKLARAGLPPESLRRASGRISQQTVLQSFDGSALMTRAVQSVYRKKHFTVRDLARNAQLSGEAAMTLTDCLVRSGYLICTSRMRYAWSALAEDCGRKHTKRA